MAGWSRTGGAAARQVAYFPDRIGIHHYPDLPRAATGVASGQIWVRQSSGALTFPGDSGSPIFIERSNGQREVFAVLFGSKRFGWDWGQGWDDIDCSGECDVYVDITRGAPRDWLLSVLRDTSRSPAWLQKHGRQDVWWGEVDYTGLCQLARDADCDHWYDEHDVCPRLFNPEQREDAPCAVTALSTRPGGASLFMVDKDEQVRSRFFPDPTKSGQWTDWFPLGSNTFPKEAVITSLSTRPGGTSLFVVDKDGLVWSRFFPDAQKGGQWSDWFPLGPNTFPVGSTISAISTKEGGTSLFIVGKEGQVWSKYFDPSNPGPRELGGWSPWFALGPRPNTFPSGTVVSALSTRPGGTSLFAVDKDGQVLSSYFPDSTKGGQWSDWFPLGPKTFPVGSVVTALSTRPGGTSLFVVAEDGQVWSKYFDPANLGPRESGGWSPWFALGPTASRLVAITRRRGPGPLPSGSVVSALSTRPGGTSLFVVGKDEQVWSQFFPDPTKSGQWSDWFPLGPDPNTLPKGQVIRAVSTKPGGTSLFVVRKDQRVWSIYWDPDNLGSPARGGWSTWFPL